MAAELRDLHCQLLSNFRGSKAVLSQLLLTDTQKLHIVDNKYIYKKGNKEEYSIKGNIMYSICIAFKLLGNGTSFA